jgi:protein TonB
MVLKGIGHGCDEEALRVIKNSSNWLSSSENGEAEPTKMVIPISFKIPE